MCDVRNSNHLLSIIITSSEWRVCLLTDEYKRWSLWSPHGAWWVGDGSETVQGIDEGKIEGTEN